VAENAPILCEIIAAIPYRDATITEVTNIDLYDTFYPE
jgi:hypothetical protein